MTTRKFDLLDAYRPSDGVVVRLCGRQAQTMMLLKERGLRGLRAFDFPGGPAYRLAAYIHSLRKAGFQIWTALEGHDGGQHAVYFLDDVVVLSNANLSAAA